MRNDLPQSISYELPATAELPRRCVPWAPDPSRSALLVHDMQQHFLRPYGAGQEPGRSLLANIGRLLTLARELNIPVFYTAQPPHQQPADRALLTDFWGPGIGSNEEGARIVEVLAPQPQDTVLTKWRYSAFQRSNLAETLHAAGRDQLVITGVYAHIGCQVSAADAFMHDIQPFMVADAVADFTAAHHAQALEWVAGRCGVVTGTDELAAAWSGATETPVPVSELVRSRVAELMYMDAADIGDHDNLLELGLDSIRIMDLVETLRADGLEVSFETLAAAATVREWAAALEGQAPALQGAGA
ncbi:bifunctional isochorismate lyase/aryl carrier protein [Arthrobacter stackebrandtii]|uniref:isochorismatase n=1 Tax=Arthrobacter stackebrandtii TaxID=272161 RepID=A0ABS4Z150_9MICC|nr:isochorismatase family protein [Arthrobacter stackebrandtii]MBP2414758.1 bifunctional isochorismate lyase/aryl carrier protein [Arthrobacter stackebrandtii]PYG99427.1 isochorismatase [Arthrobacter stackebrandtii]